MTSLLLTSAINPELTALETCEGPKDLAVEDTLGQVACCSYLHRSQ
jgi:hypothetical protein